MLVVALFVLGLLLVRPTGGRYRGLVALTLRARPLVLVSFVCQFLVLQGPDLPGAVAPVLHVLTYVAAAVFVWLNRRVAGLPLVAAGAVLNGATIALNGGTLPAARGAQELAGLADDGGFANSAVVDDPVLPWLGDVFAVPSWVPFANVFSVGDVLVVAGAWWLLWSCSRVRPLPDALPELPDALPRQASAERTADSGTSIQDGRLRVSYTTSYSALSSQSASTSGPTAPRSVPDSSA